MESLTRLVSAERRAAGEVCIRPRTCASSPKSAPRLRRPLRRRSSWPHTLWPHTSLGDAVFLDATIISFRRVFDSGVISLNRASSGLVSIVTKALHRAPASESPLLAWPVACGSAVAERSRALSFSDGILQVEVAVTGWRRELAHLAPRYVALINKYSATPVKR